MFNSIFFKSTLAFTYRLIGAGITFAFGVFFARIMPIEEYGLLVSLMSVALIGSTVGVAGQQMQLLRDLPTLAHLNDYPAVAAAASKGLFVAFVGGALVTLGAMLVGSSVHNSSNGTTVWAYRISLCLILPLAVIEVQSAVGRAVGSINIALIPKDVLWRLLVIVFGGLLFLGHGERITSPYVLAVAVVTLILLIGVQQLYLRRLMCGNALFSLKAVGNTTSVLARVRESIPFWGTSIGNILFATVDVFIVSVVIGPKASGYYYAANRISLLLDFFLVAFSIPAASTIVRLYDEGRNHEITHVTSSAALLAFGATSLGLLILVLGGGQVLSIFGPDFAMSRGILLILAAGQVASAYLGVGIIALNMTGHQWAALRIMCITSVTGLATMVFATWAFGAWGTAAVAATWIVTMKAWMAIQLYLTEGIDTTATSELRDAITRLSKIF
jgi:O-antigen/teichoic acid export membrane protein